MFAPPVAKAQTKAAESSARKLAPQHSTLAARPFGDRVLEQAHMLQRSIGNQATLRLLADRAWSPAGDQLDELLAQEPERMRGRAATPGLSQSFSKFPLFPPDRTSPPQAPSRLAVPSLPSARRPKLSGGEAENPLGHESGGGVAVASSDTISRGPAVASASVVRASTTASTSEADDAGPAASEPIAEGTSIVSRDTADTDGGTASGPTQDAATSTWGWGGPATQNVYQTCNIQVLDRAAFLNLIGQSPQGPTGASPVEIIRSNVDVTLGITTTDVSQGKLPEISATPVQDGNKTSYRLNPTHAEMAPIQSAATKAGDFIEGTETYAVQSGGSCRTGAYPVHWFVTQDGAAKIKAGEQEHCDDLRTAFDLTLATYASGINNVAAANRSYDTEQQAIADAVSYIGVTPSRMLRSYARLAQRTNTRDTRGWHTAKGRESKPEDTGCAEFRWTIAASALPNVGTHSSEEIINPANAAP